MNVNLDAVSDITKISISQIGSNLSEFTLDRQMLANDKSYVGSISKFDIDLGTTHMLTTNQFNYSLFEIKRRHVGQVPPPMTDLSIQRADILANGSNIFNIDPRTKGIINTPSDFLRRLFDFVTTFDKLQRSPYDLNGIEQVAIDPNLHSTQHTDLGVTVGEPLGTYLLKLGLDQSGKLHFNGSARFWSNFYIEFSSYGKELLGIDHTIMCAQATNGTLNDTPDNLIDQNLVIANANVGQPLEIVANQSVYRSMDHRLGIMVQVLGLNIPNSISISNNEETIGNFALDIPYPSKCILETDFASNTWDFGEDTTISTLVTQPTHWFKLSDVFDLRYLRVQILMRRREFNPLTETWKIETQPMVFGKKDYWNVQMSFVSI